MDKKCIWCSKEEQHVSFKQKAHTFPQSLGGQNLCVNVCDSCNHFFGSKTSAYPSVELVLKEVLNTSRYLLLYQMGKVPKGKRHTSEFFKINWTKKSISHKPKYRLKKGFQQMLGRRFRRGIYMIYLEERERVKGDAHDERFNFIREFARYDLSDYPVYVFQPKYGWVFSSDELLLNPDFNFPKGLEEQERHYGVYTPFIMGHYFCIPTSKNFENFSLNRYLNYLKFSDHPFGTNLIPINYVLDVDFTFSFLNK